MLLSGCRVQGVPRRWDVSVLLRWGGQRGSPVNAPRILRVAASRSALCLELAHNGPLTGLSQAARPSPGGECAFRGLPGPGRWERKTRIVPRAQTSAWGRGTPRRRGPRPSARSLREGPSVSAVEEPVRSCQWGMLTPGSNAQARGEGPALSAAG